MVKKLLMIAMAVTMISGTSLATVYANANPPAEETTTAVVEETTTEKSKDTEKAEDTGRVTGESNNSAFSTPGNAQLVDDKENDDTKQFLTIQTKKGNTFYMVNMLMGNQQPFHLLQRRLGSFQPLKYTFSADPRVHQKRGITAAHHVTVSAAPAGKGTKIQRHKSSPFLFQFSVYRILHLPNCVNIRKTGNERGKRLRIIPKAFSVS